MKKLSLQAMVALARGRGGRCISTFYINSTVPLVWECAAGHRWSSVAASIGKGSWCPHCAGVRRLTLERMRRIAESRGGRCLSEHYWNNATKLEWRCSEGHRWSATPLQVKKGHWCPNCARVARLTLQELQQMAFRKGGECLSPKYLGSSKPLRWMCDRRHEWSARPSSVRAGSWCPVCAHNRRLRLDEMQRVAKERRGRCLSSHYTNGSTPLLWMCHQGHCWKATPTNVKGGSRKKGTWCMACYNLQRRFRAKHNIEVMKELAIARGGTCESAEYIGSKAKLVWQCAARHRWQALPTSVAQGTWCPVCAHNQRLELSTFHDIAATRGGVCLSLAYLNERTALWWRCAEKHEWNATPSKVKRGSWCPVCAHIRRKSQWARRGADRWNELTRGGRRRKNSTSFDPKPTSSRSGEIKQVIFR
jgi:hypothetical protein